MQDEINCSENLEVCKRLLGQKKIEINASGSILYLRLFQNEMAIRALLPNESKSRGYPALSSDFPR
jgi:hypothetical protein